jgi:hypothetical protein
MTKQEHLFVKLMEECAEVQHRTSKLLQFGAEECEPGQHVSNRRRLLLEVMDLLTIIGMLQQAGFLPNYTEELCEHLDAKERRVKKYLRYSQELGRVEP